VRQQKQEHHNPGKSQQRKQVLGCQRVVKEVKITIHTPENNDALIRIQHNIHKRYRVGAQRRYDQEAEKSGVGSESLPLKQ
jgi:hypothetical protein